MLYIEFEIKSVSKFQDFKAVYDVLYKLKRKEKSKGMAYWEKAIPGYAQAYLARFNQVENEQHYLVRESFESIVNYLEFGLEVDLEHLTQTGDTGKLEYYALAYPYGGMDRLLAVLRAFELIPTKSFNGFSVIAFQWTNEFYYDHTELPEETERYKEEMRLRK